MEYQCPEPADLANVEALNQAFLRWLHKHQQDLTPRSEAAKQLGTRLGRLDDKAVARLARAPFLLMSLDEHDERRWREVFADTPCADLFDTQHRRSEIENRLTLALLGFLWQLARRNPYTTRLVSGATLEWCDHLATLSLVALYAQVGRCPPLQPRLSGDAEFWDKLLGGGTSSRREVRLAARASAMQTVIAGSAMSMPRQFPAAACNMPSVPTRVAARRRC
jgi:hypothetical protein